MAAGAEPGPGWTDYTGLGQLESTSKYYYAVRLAVKDNPRGCHDKTRLFRNDGATGANKMYLTLLEAVKANLKLRVYVTGNCNFHGYSEISSVGVAPAVTI